MSDFMFSIANYAYSGITNLTVGLFVLFVHSFNLSVC